MSELTTAARPYAKAVFELARDSGTLPAWSEQLAAMSAVVASEGSSALLSNPKLSSTQKVDVIGEIIGDKLTADGRNLLAALGENDRFSLLPDMTVIFEQLRAAQEGVMEVEVVSAMGMSDQQQNTIAAALQKRLGREIKMVTRIDPSLLGGAIIRAGDLVIDGSIQSRLNSMKAALGR
ncbi:MAG: F0F1 ATP synthase subunit delta [Thiothrix sp.]|nr:F0F1 ATP synthase subunit delta [Thiothrix sp.]HPE60809.1 F0F1 ATP synthase subunit delta [Thiolinea sp.]